ncbi:MAG: tRNA (adenosine(37)-N6)-dimethylallyltransferase MiaA [Bacteroidales bacterium]
MDKTSSVLITVLGPTASGKTSFAARLAHCIDGEIISADSRQVYRRMDIGTGKDYSDYIIEGKAIPYHLIDIVEPGYKYSLFEYQRDFLNAWNDINGRGKKAILCGGSGMYIESVLDAYRLVNVPIDEDLRKELEAKTEEELIDILSSLRKLHNVSDITSKQRLIRAIEIAVYMSQNKEVHFSFPRFDKLIFGIHSDREKRRQRITERLGTRLKEGLIEEVQQLLDEGVDPGSLIFYGLEYKYITLYLIGRMEYEEMKDRLKIAIHQFGKRQMTWFRKMERSGYSIHWLDSDMEMDEKLTRAIFLIKKRLSASS